MRARRRSPFDDIKDIDDVNEYHKAEIKHFFEQYRLWSRAKFQGRLLDWC